MLQNIPEYKSEDVISLEIEVKGSTEPFHLLLEPYAIIIPGENFIGVNVRKTFKVCLLLTSLLSSALCHWMSQKLLEDIRQSMLFYIFLNILKEAVTPGGSVLKSPSKPPQPYTPCSQLCSFFHLSNLIPQSFTFLNVLLGH